MPLKLMYITNDPRIAMIADRTGVDRVWIDLEQLHKEERQKGLNTVKSKHSLEDIRRIKPVLQSAELQVRINPIHESTKTEIDTAIDYGADVLMLPYFKTAEEVNTFLRIVNGRVKTILLVETKEAVECLDELLKTTADEIHIGLNDLHLSLKMDFMFEPLANGMLDSICAKIRQSGKPYGFGGIAKLGEGMLPAEYVVAEHYRLKSSAAILSRSFYDTVDASDYEAIEYFFSQSMLELRKYEQQLESEGTMFFEANHRKVQQIVGQIVEKKRALRCN